MDTQRKLIFPIFVSVTLLGAGCGSDKQAGNNVSLNAGYIQVVDSFRGGSMLFSCGFGSTTFRISSGIFSNPKLYWKDGIQWHELEDASFQDTGIVFTGLGRTGGVPLNKISSSIQISIFNPGSTYDKKKPVDYFKKVNSATFVPFKYTVDMLNEKMTSINIEPIIDYVELDEEKYRKEQSIIPYSFAFSDAQRQEEDQKKKHRMRQIEAAVKEVSSPIRLETAAFAYEEESYCRRVE